MIKVIGIIATIIVFSVLIPLSAAGVTLKGENMRLTQINEQQAQQLEQYQHTSEVLVKMCSDSNRDAP